MLDDLKLGGEYTNGDRGEVAEATVTDVISSIPLIVLILTITTRRPKQCDCWPTCEPGTSSVDFYQENQFVDENDGHGRIDSYGFGYDATEDVKWVSVINLVKLKMTKTSPLNANPLVNAAISLDDINLSHKLEYRIDKSEDDPDIAQRASTNRNDQPLYASFNRRVRTLFGKYNYSITRVKLQVRPWRNSRKRLVALRTAQSGDRLNLLGRYTYLADFDHWIVMSIIKMKRVRSSKLKRFILLINIEISAPNTRIKTKKKHLSELHWCQRTYKK